MTARNQAEVQRLRMLCMLRTGPKTTLDFRAGGIMQSQTRIFELRALGYDLPTVGRVTVHDDRGYPHQGVAVYELLAEPLASTTDSPVAHSTGDLFGPEGSV